MKTLTQPKRFDPAPWFDKLSEYGKRKTPLTQVLLYRAQRVPNRKNLELFRGFVVTIKPAKLRMLVLASVDGILDNNREITGNYKFRFRNSTASHLSSATGELFSLVRQALTYHDKD
jgi:hypothetical protein